ncbi:NADP-dependent phosphogluconate dehydrogenase [Gillisia limnaea]|uniref:6-phosphogluconate dehydrogenase, decarboxylating n=1 Tax=Gillisia limnaea (strain DSM 15749 / LMG 21470 / R-8282) TaxID=865937 RepID=H2BYL8_GILLR|nr:NADP-dependent phosphogluconate dehydrogenase [Gillisia limnaea]EHQ01139.1 6-phosphogluconate dehydrogenase, decarboxylating [Gillisia limnaea DSM 15749]
MIFIIAGVSGAGKTTIGKLLSEKLELPFYDADDFHPPENVAKMASGIPLKDEDRESWLQTLSNNITNWNSANGAVLACSALKEKYREKLQGNPKQAITWILLNSEYEVILNRLSSRKGHYFKPSLLQSQFEALEIPSYGLYIDINKSEDQIIEEIMNKLEHPKSKIGLLGLGVMGKSLTLNLASKEFKVSVYNRHVDRLEVDIAKNFAEANKKDYNFPWFDELKDFVDSLEKPRNILLMVNAGKTVDVVIKDLLPLLDIGDLIIDGGNSHYKDTRRREQDLKEKGLLFMGMGVSGGEEGALKGPSIMPGGSHESYKRVGGIFEKIAAKDPGGKPCCIHVGPDGAGHFVKMLHNGIEYGEMQLIAEIYHYLRFSIGIGPKEIASLFKRWNLEMKSYLLEISADILETKEGDEFLIDKILDAAKQKGTGGWSTNAALELGVPFDTITAAVLARNISAKKEERQKAMDLYNMSSTKEDRIDNFNSSELFSAYKTVSIINHAIGFDLLSEASREYDWDLNLSEIARIWTNGCIIRSAFMEDLIWIFKEQPGENILIHPKIVTYIKSTKNTLTKITSEALVSGIPVPVLSAGANCLLGYISGQTSANMIQAQRDYFGAHTYERTDKPRGEFFHTQWKSAN